MALTPNGMADAIETAFELVWGQLKAGEQFPVDGRPDRRVLFLAIARGVLTYLENHQGELITSIGIDIGGVFTGTTNVNGVDLNTDLS